MRRTVEPLAVATDSVAALPAELAGELGVAVLPLTVTLDGVSYRDGIDLSPAAFYLRLVQSGGRALTSQPSAGEAHRFLKGLAERAERVLFLAVHGRLSGTARTVRMAAARLEEEAGPPRVEVVDTRTAAGAQALLATAAARAAGRGEGAEAVRRRVLELRRRVRFEGVLETLEYVARSGRVPWLAARAAGGLGVRLVIALRHGRLLPAGAVGSLEAGLERMLEHVEREVETEGGGEGARLHAAVLHAANAGLAEEARRRLERLRPTELWTAPMTPVIGAYTGPGALALAWYVEPAGRG
ncbi:MAG: DegV family EDD domain-containing protein [Firmicutes bacterium]|nr:DegV family EDD domain-containing protein [Bacillota bacterium]